MFSIETILVPVDFSGHSNKAVDHAIALARQLGARVELLHAFHLPAATTAAYDFAAGVAAGPPGLWKDLEASASKQLDELLDEAKSQAGDVSLNSKMITESPAVAICDRAKEIGADLIVMGTCGRTGLSHVLLGSVAERTIRQAPCPVLTVK